MEQMNEINPRELVLTRIMNAPANKLFACWTEPELIKQWFCPPPFTISDVKTELRAGGASCITMRSPEGVDFPNRGVYLEVVTNQRIVFTDAYLSAWEPAEKPFMTVTVTFEDLGNNTTRYIARAMHWSVEDRETHEKMGFHQGWGIAADQLEALAKTL